MAGLTAAGFTALLFSEIKARISARLETFSPGIDLSIESPDGQLVEIFSYEVAQAWNELGLVYKSYDPTQAFGAGLRNIGLITGIEYGAATRSQAFVQLIGVTGTLVPAGSLVEDNSGNEFEIQFDATIPATVIAISTVSGVIPVPAGTLVNIKSPITGWNSVTQTDAGRTGATAQTETAFRNIRNRTVLRNYTDNIDVTEGRLVELGLEQVLVVHNDDPIITLPDGTPPNQIHVTISPVASITDEDVARVILETKPAGVSTYGTTAVAINDSQGNPHTINFTKATAVSIYINVGVTYLSEDTAGAQEDITAALVDHINSLQVGEDVIHSRLYGLITPYGKAQVNILEVGKVDGTETAANVALTDTEFAYCETSFIDFTVV